MTDITLTTTVDFTASKEKVWQGLTDPALIKQYFFGTQLITDWTIGSPIIWTGEWDGVVYKDKGTVLEVIPNELVKYSYWSSMSGTEDVPENYQVVSYRLDDNNGGARLTITQENIADESKKEHSEQNWQALMAELKKLIE
jgi:uncharacterized protein YndB with AHSA1/START domain